MMFGFWLALAAFATLCTASFAILAPTTRIYLTAGAGAAGWGITAITAPGVTTIADDGTEVSYAAGLEVQLFLTGLAAFSLLVLILYYLGLYPPEVATDPTQPEQ